MKKTSLAGGLIVTVFALAFLTLAARPVTESDLPKAPIWQIAQEGTDKPIQWADYSPNPRFAIYDAGTPENLTDDLVLDKETSLVWERSPSTDLKDHTFAGVNTAIMYAFSLSKGNRLGWRIPVLEELLSLVAREPASDGLYLPTGHPFVNIQAKFYWSTTGTTSVYCVDLSTKEVNYHSATEYLYVWCVRGGAGISSY